MAGKDEEHCEETVEVEEEILLSSSVTTGGIGGGEHRFKDQGWFLCLNCSKHEQIYCSLCLDCYKCSCQRPCCSPASEERKKTFKKPSSSSSSSSSSEFFATFNEKHLQLIFACREGDFIKVQSLAHSLHCSLPKGINTIDELNNTPIYYAILCGHLEIVEHLFELGASVDLSRPDGQRYFLAAQRSEVRNLIRKNAIFTIDSLSTTERIGRGLLKGIRIVYAPSLSFTPLSSSSSLLDINPFTLLPFECLVAIAEYLTDEQLLSMAQVCKIWREVCDSNLIWQPLWQIVYNGYLDLPLLGGVELLEFNSRSSNTTLDLGIQLPWYLTKVLVHEAIINSYRYPSLIRLFQENSPLRPTSPKLAIKPKVLRRSFKGAYLETTRSLTKHTLKNPIDFVAERNLLIFWKIATLSSSPSSIFPRRCQLVSKIKFGDQLMILSKTWMEEPVLLRFARVLIRNNSVMQLEELLQDIHQRPKPYFTYHFHQTIGFVIFLAAFLGRTECIRVIASRYPLKTFPEAALSFVSIFGNVESVTYLLGEIPEYFMWKREGLNPLMMAAIRGYSDIVNAILSNSVPDKQQRMLEAKDSAGFTSLHLAIAHAHPEVVEILLRFGANPQVVTVKGNTCWSLLEEIDLLSSQKIEQLLFPFRKEYEKNLQLDKRNKQEEARLKYLEEKRRALDHQTDKKSKREKKEERRAETLMKQGAKQQKKMRVQKSQPTSTN